MAGIKTNIVFEMNKHNTVNNLIKSNKELLSFKNENLRFSVSSRNINPYYSIHDFLNVFFPFVNTEQVESLFGSTFIPSPLYGGRPYSIKRSIYENHERELAELDIHISLTLTNHFFSPELYEQSLPLLERYHSNNNSIICVNDELAKQIRRDFSKYKLRASLIKNIKTLKTVEESYKLYDYVVIPMDKNDDDRFLLSLPEKERIMLFGNASCAYTCTKRLCYKGISENNRGIKTKVQCSRKNDMERLELGHVFFDVKKFNEMGFSFIKLIPYVNQNVEDDLKFLIEKKYKKQFESVSNNAVHIVSFPKSGRTWLRFILANYYNMYFGINEEIDLKNMFEFMPNNNHFEEMKGYYKYRFKNRKDVPLVLFSHDGYNHSQYENKKVIFLKRNPIDTIVSYYFHIRFKPGYQGSISEFIRDEKYGINKIVKFIKKWGEELNENQMQISYEEMHEDMDNLLRKVIKYIGLNINEEYLSKAIQLSHFKEMKKVEKKTKVPGCEGQKDDDDMRVRQGEISNYKKYLNQKNVEFCMKIVKSKQ